MGEVGRAVALILASGLALQSPPPAAPVATAPAASRTTPGDPAPRQAVAGLKSLECASTVVYASLPDAPHRLQASYAFPDRARWWLGVGAEPSTRRQMRFRFGAAFFAVDADSGVSRRLEDKDDNKERTLTCIQLEMRRALFLWPHDFQWKRTEKSAVAPLADLGTLTVTFADAAAKNPSTLAFAAADGTAGDEYRGITWRNEKDKAWPTRLELWHAKALVWTETVDSIDTGMRFIDSFFVPPDTRAGAGAKSLEIGAVRPTDVPEIRSLRIALPAHTSWDTARSEQARLASEQASILKPRGLKLDDRATFEVSEDLEPTAVLLRLGPWREPLDPEVAKVWLRTPERPGLSTFVMGVSALLPKHLSALRSAAPADAACGTPYVRFDPAHPDQHVLVLLPLVPRDESPPKDH
jgi:hypothetical protein